MAHQTIQEVVARARDFAALCRDEYTETRHMAFDPAGDLRFHGISELGSTQFLSENDATPTEDALRQITERLEGPTGWILREPNRTLASDVLNDLIRHRPADKKWLMRMRETRGPASDLPSQMLRAALSDSYTRFDHVKFLEMVERGLAETGTTAQVHRVELHDDLRAYILLPEITFPDRTPNNPNGTLGNGGLHPAIYIRNSEIGGGKARVHAAIYRSVCSNGLIYGWRRDESIGAEVVHAHKSEAAIWILVSSGIADALKMTEEAAQRFIEASTEFVEPRRLRSIVDGWVAKYGLTLEYGKNWLEAITWNASEYGRAKSPTMFDVVNGASSVAQTLDGPEREQAEIMAGELIRPIVDEVDSTTVSIRRSGRPS